jgi:hypothetical protein
MTDAFMREADALYKVWVDKEFPNKMMAYLLSLNQRESPSKQQSIAMKERPKL